jgi:hypothetical protein
LSQFIKNNNTFYSTNCHKAFKNIGLGSGIQDPGSGKNLFRIPEPKRHRIPDPDPQPCQIVIIIVHARIVFKAQNKVSLNYPSCQNIFILSLDPIPLKEEIP